MSRKAVKTDGPSIARVASLFEFDREKGKGAAVVGIDEAGRGPWAGPVAAAAVVFPEKPDLAPLANLTDSKKLTPHQRETLAESIRAQALAVGVGIATPEEIDRYDILRATFLAMKRALLDLGVIPELAIVDGNKDPRLGLPTVCVVKGDSLSASTAAASIIAKTDRDRRMDLLADEDDRWGFSHHKGYGTELHQHAMAVFGISPHHRRTYKPVSRHLMHPGPTALFMRLWRAFQNEEAMQDEALLTLATEEMKRLPSDEAWMLDWRMREISSSSAPGNNRRQEGGFYETMAATFLIDKGMTILEKNFHGMKGEIDIIARDGETIVFAEVRKKGSLAYGDAISSVTLRKRKRMTAVAWEYLMRFEREVDCRFDILAFEPDAHGGARLHHYPSAFEACEEDAL